MSTRMKISQKRKCEGKGEYSVCKALSSYLGAGNRKAYCTLNYKTSHRKVCIYFVYYDVDIKPLEPCPKPMTYLQLIEAREQYQKA